MSSPMDLCWRTVVDLLRLLPIGPRSLASRPWHLAVPTFRPGFLASPYPPQAHIQSEDTKFTNADKFAERIQRELSDTNMHVLRWSRYLEDTQTTCSRASLRHHSRMEQQQWLSNTPKAIPSHSRRSLWHPLVVYVSMALGWPKRLVMRCD